MTSGIMYEFSNRTVYGIESEAIRYTWAGYFLFVIISSLIGDTAILIASIKYRAFKLHKIIVVIIQHIAVCDLMVSITDVLPKLISVIASENVFSTFLCYLSPYLRYYFNPANVLLICAMCSSKLYTLKFPLRSGAVTLTRTHMMCVGCWLAAFTFPVAFLILDWKDIYFSYRGYQCNYAYSSPVYHWLKPLLAVVFLFIPTCLVVATSVNLLIIAKKVARRCRGSLKWQGIMTTVLIATVYCISIIPMVVYRVGESRIKIDDKSRSFYFTHLYRIAISFPFLNIISNFYIYSLTVSGFRDFVWSTMQLPFRLSTKMGAFTRLW